MLTEIINACDTKPGVIFAVTGDTNYKLNYIGIVVFV